jgi:small-conductance mechanosensitive channel
MKSLKLLILLCCIALSLFAKKEDPKDVSKIVNEVELNASINEKKSKISDIDDKLSKNIWLKRYSDFLTYKTLNDEQDDLRAKISHLKKRDDADEELRGLQKKLENVKKQLAVYGDGKPSAFGDLVKISEVAGIKKVDNPMLIFSALSTIRSFDEKKNLYESRLEEIDKLVESLKAKKELAKELETLLSKSKVEENATKKEARQAALEATTRAIVDIKNERDDFEISVSIFHKKSAEIAQRLKFEAKEQLLKLLNIGLVVVALFAISFVLKLLVKRYFAGRHENAYAIKKIIGATTYFLVALTLLFSYIENVSYLVTILGFASAGIAIAMKDWFMSILGWFAITTSGIIKVGDRIKVTSKDGGEILGDVLDISPLKVTLYEDVTLLSVEKHKRAGRVIFMPNNFVFTHLILNYSHDGLSTVWDNVNIVLSFDSDMAKATELAIAVTSKHTKTYSRLTERASSRLRNRYSMYIHRKLWRSAFRLVSQPLFHDSWHKISRLKRPARSHK